MSNRENSTKIFISSTAQQNLQPLRKRLREVLDSSGHIAVLFEENFGIWSDDTLGDCLEKVAESDIYVLFISNESGSFTTIDPNITATYAEYLKAIEEQKIIIPFIESHLFGNFTNFIFGPLKDKIQEYIDTYDREPNFTYDIVKKMIKEEPKESFLYKKLTESNVHPFQWAFMYDVYTKQWVYKAALAETENSCQFIIESLSQLLKKLTPYYPLMSQINEAITTADRLTTFKNSLPVFMQYLRGGTLDIKNILYALSHFLKGGSIQHNDSPLDKRVIAQVSNCDAICLYQKQMDKFTLIAYYGSITPTLEYDTKDTDSFVTTTYQWNNEEVEYVFYSAKKQKIYLTKKFGDLVISAHFKLSENWTEKRTKSYEAQILRAIMNERDQFDFAIDLIGGMLND